MAGLPLRQSKAGPISGQTVTTLNALPSFPSDGEPDRATGNFCAVALQLPPVYLTPESKNLKQLSV